MMVMKKRWWHNKEYRIRRRLTMTLHDTEELDDDLGARSDHDLALSGLLGIVDRVKSVGED